MSELDEVRSLLLQLTQSQVNFQQQQARTQQQLDQVQQQQERTQQQLDQLSADVAETSQALRESIPDLTAMVGEVLHSMNAFTAELRAEMAADRADRAADRVAETQTRNEFRRQMSGLQNESRNILRELAEMRRQQRNDRHE